MTLAEAVASATDKAERFGATRLVIERTDHPNIDGTTYYTIRATDKYAWTPGERCLVIVCA